MKIEMLDTLSLIPYARNARINDATVSSVAASIKEFGFKNPIIIDKENIIIAGHTRHKAAQQLGLVSVPCIRAEDLTPEQAKAFRILDNKIQERSEWNNELLQIELLELEKIGFEFDPFEVEFDLGDFGINQTSEEDDFEIPEDDKIQTSINLGDVIEIGNHRLICGDSTDAEGVAKLMKEVKADACITDPPYGINMDKGFDGFDGFGGFGKPIKRRKYKDKWDGEIPNHTFVNNILNNSQIVLIFGGNFFTHILPQSNHWVFWDKEQSMPSFGDGELIWTNIKRNSVKKFVCTYNGLIGKEEERFHPTQKPVKIIKMLINEYLDNGKLILDIFLGSGTTMVAAHQLGRICYGMEISPKYCQVIIDRMKALDPTLTIKINGELYETS